MPQTQFYLQPPEGAAVTVSVILPRYRGKWVFCRRHGRDAWEFPGGHREVGETLLQTARRELWEETGIEKAEFHSVVCFQTGSLWGMLYFAEVEALGQIPAGSEIGEVRCSELLPERCAYENLPLFYDYVQGWLNLQSGADEMWDVYDAQRRPTGRLHRRGDPMPEGDYHLVVHIWTRRRDGRYLLTLRSPNKGFPNLWEPTGGSALSGDDSLTAAIREVREETGLCLHPEEGILVQTRPWIDHFDDIWLFDHDFDLSEVRLLEGETCDAMVATAAEILQLQKEGRLVPIDDLPALLAQMEAM